jgi:predicted DNA-binding transcriptional regulator YafY
MLLLQVNHSLTARELAQRLEVSERTIHRDMEALGAAGIPVVAERGVGGGWRLRDEYRTDLTGLNEAEIQALFLSRPPQLLADLGMNQAADAGLIKLLAALPSFSRRGAEYARQRILIDVGGWRQSEDAVAQLPVLQDAVWRERRVRMSYERADGSEVERLVDPLGLVAKGSLWYLIAGVDGDIRTYRVSRVRAAELTDEPCTRPADFDLAAYWEQSSAQFKANLPRYRASLRADPAVVRRMRAEGRYTRIECEGLPEADGRVQVEVLFEGQQHAREYVLGFGTQLEVLAPAELREYVTATARAIVEFYGRKTTMPYTIRLAAPEDEPFLWDMLFYAANMADDGAISGDQARDHPYLAKYVRSWGREGDVGTRAVDLASDRPVGAAWVRLLEGAEKNYPSVAAGIPELAIAV